MGRSKVLTAFSEGFPFLRLLGYLFFLFCLARGIAGAQLIFTPSLQVPTGQDPVTVATVDLNRDGWADIVAGSRFDWSIVVALGQPGGGFQPSRVYETGADPHSIASADFNSDGFLDLAVADVETGDIAVLFGQGEGILSKAKRYIVGRGIIGVATGDLTGDGLPDLAGADVRRNRLVILRGTGDGDFLRHQELVTDKGPHPVVLADFDGDGDLDLATANLWADNLYIFVNDGKGNFSYSLTLPTGALPRMLVTSDFNGDGWPDLAVANYGSGTITVYENREGKAFERFSKDLPAGKDVYGLLACDLNGDGWPEIVATAVGEDAVHIFLGGPNPKQRFRERVTIGGIIGPESVATADFNRDGLPDLVVGNLPLSSVTLLLNKSPVRPRWPEVKRVLPESAPQGTLVKILGQGFGPNQGEKALYFGEVRSSWPVYWSETEIYVHVPRGAGTPITVEVAGTKGPGVSFQRLLWGDIDRDGKLTIADLQKILAIAQGSLPVLPEQFFLADVWPISSPFQIGDGQITLEDVRYLLKVWVNPQSVSVN